MESEKKIASTTIPVIIHEPSSPDERMFASRSRKLSSQRSISNNNISLVYQEGEKSEIMELNSEYKDEKRFVWADLNSENNC